VARETAGPPVIVTLPDEIDFNNQAAAAAGLRGALDACGLVIADMTGTTFCDSSGMRMLAAARDHAEASGSVLRIVIRPGGSVERALAIVGIGSMLRVYPSLDDAVQARPCAGQQAL
jgi:anti-sigma B factor antagonist